VTDLVVPAEPKGLDLALLKAVGLDRAAPEQRALAINIAERYELDLLLKHLVLIEGRPYITRDALLHIAHRSGQFDGISVTEPKVSDGYWRCSATVYRKDMTHPFTYPGRYPERGGNAKFAEEMCIKVAESMALRRAFNVAAPVVEERWDTEPAAEPPAPRPSLAERAAAATVTVLAEPMTPEASATISKQPERAEYANLLGDDREPRYPKGEEDVAGLTVEAFKDLYVKGGKSSVVISKAIGCKVDEVGGRVKGMTAVERGVLADELNLDWRA